MLFLNLYLLSLLSLAGDKVIRGVGDSDLDPLRKYWFNMFGQGYIPQYTLKTHKMRQ